MSNCRTEIMAETLKTAVKKIVIDNGSPWDATLFQVDMGYRFRDMVGRKTPFEMMYGVPPRTTDVVYNSLPKNIGTMGDEIRAVELMGVGHVRAEMKKNSRNPTTETSF